jgi:3-hydroxyacyl-[acyl-carrier-protein] dehydratase
MSVIKKEIRRLMKDYSEIDSNNLNARFIFPEDFIGFKGHFPSGKILPGVCHIQCVILMMEMAKNKPVLLKEIVQAKYMSPILPSEEVLCICNCLEDKGDIIIRATFSREGSRISELKLRVRV